MSNPDREKEKSLLAQWFARVSFDEPSEGLPELEPEEGDD